MTVPRQIILGALLAVLALGPAAADMRRPTQERARQLLTEGNLHYKVREFDQAVALYKQGALLEPVPLFWYNLGQAFRQQGRYKEAIWYYKRYLAEADGDDERAQVAHFIDAMQKELDRGAQSENPLAPAPDVAARPAPAPAPAPAPPPAPAPLAPAPTPAPAHGRTMRLAGYGVGGAGLLLTGVGLAVGAGARSTWNDARAMCDGPAVPLACTARGVALHDEASRSATIATLTVATGLLAVAAGATLVILAPRERPLAIAPTVGPAGAGLTLTGGF